ncbi:MAG: hypothetical protein P4L46_23005 [Fimbriimonas sp.]|nr:hypothetical protein [Fimbriimonas sp.]
MSEGSFGVMVHWLAPGPWPQRGKRIVDNDKAVEAFDLDCFISEFGSSRADWLIFTIGQNMGYYASPNSVLDRYGAVGRCSKRDLVLEIAQRVKTMGKRFIAYLPSEVNAQDEVIKRAFAWTDELGTEQAAFQRRYTEFIAEYSLRFGDLCDGWWYDGCYGWEAFNNRLYDFPEWIRASRLGNANAAVAFNDGCFCCGFDQPVTPLQDALFGEVETLIDGKIRLGRDPNSPLILPQGRFVPGTNCQWHAMVPINGKDMQGWFHGEEGEIAPACYSDEELFSFVDRCRAVRGAVTLNALIYQEGHLGEDGLAQLERLGRHLVSG